VVLAVGMEPSVKGVNIPAEVMSDSSGFIMATRPTRYFRRWLRHQCAGCEPRRASATAAALRAIQVRQQSRPCGGLRKMAETKTLHTLQGLRTGNRLDTAALLKTATKSAR